ncbi:Receptor-like cytosolic serine/threonine-protein kinase RBK2 [Capsicum annuum]|uniref:non-specific serine/threonine protein kinase n=1 Tax=Capsicum annuum TaxID=4072 RepID=A0A2G2YZ52_CAPAN|nr:Receptor-like cytosolic serine/threonine-protein kinase RBK2 [Capsicum annuum]PHT75040.1 Receptor-like cytosolic serine/threonine-protein kinase RBK2 [Capsicum annuum]
MLSSGTEFQEGKENVQNGQDEVIRDCNVKERESIKFFLIKVVARPTCMRPHYSIGYLLITGATSCVLLRSFASCLRSFRILGFGISSTFLDARSRKAKSSKRISMDGVRTSENKAVNAGPKNISCSASAQDLRLFEMDREKYDDSSPRGVIEASIRNQEGGSNFPKAEPSGSEICSSHPRTSSRWHKFFKMWKKSSVKRLPSFPPLAVPRISTRKSRSARENVAAGFYHFKSSWKNFSLSELKNATNNFSKENLIGKGGYAEVYKGCLPDGQLIAVKRLNKGTPEEQEQNFLCEIGTIAHVDHPNTARMVGYGVEGGTYLILQLSSLGSLGSFLRGSRDKLDWAARYKIIFGIANGLLYLHENCQRRIIHRDIKADNILLTEDFVPQICDFGLAKWLPKEWTHHNVGKFEGTFGYFAPEYFMHGTVDEKTDVFSFGVLLLEIITGRQALDDSQQSLVIWAKPLLEKDNVKELIDPVLGDKYNPKEMERVILTAGLCVEQNPLLRPRMNQASSYLLSITLISYSLSIHAIVLMKTEDECYKQKFQRRRTYSEELMDAAEYNSTKCLNDLKQINLRSSVSDVNIKASAA